MTEQELKKLQETTKKLKAQTEEFKAAKAAYEKQWEKLEQEIRGLV